MWTELAKDARFLASLPPIQGVINSRIGVDRDTEDGWRSQLQSIFSSALRSSPYYLALSFEAKESDNAEDVVRTERNSADPTLVRVLPTGRLQTVKADQLMATVSILEPGDVKFSLEPRTRYGSDLSRGERLSVATPVYSDVSGDCVGMTVVEADVSERVMEVLTGLGTVDCEIYVADGLGHLWGSANPTSGVHIAEPGQTIPNLPNDVSEQLGKKGAPFNLRGENRYIAQRFYVDPTGRGLMIFARLADE
jgi:hypothetical protein